jgi:hypothetical protein
MSCKCVCIFKIAGLHCAFDIRRAGPDAWLRNACLPEQDTTALAQQELAVGHAYQTQTKKRGATIALIVMSIIGATLAPVFSLSKLKL